MLCICSWDVAFFLSERDTTITQDQFTGFRKKFHLLSHVVLENFWEGLFIVQRTNVLWFGVF